MISVSGSFNNDWFIHTIVVIELHTQSLYSENISAYVFTLLCNECFKKYYEGLQHVKNVPRFLSIEIMRSRLRTLSET